MFVYKKEPGFLLVGEECLDVCTGENQWQEMDFWLDMNIFFPDRVKKAAHVSRRLPNSQFSLETEA